MNDPYPYPYVDRNWTSGQQDGFPGLEAQTFSGPPAEIHTPTVLPAAPAASGASALLSKLPFNIQNLNDVKALVDRMGGIEGVIATAGKVQKFMSTVQQVAPLIKLFMGKKGSSSSSSGVSTSRPRRRRRTSAKRKPAARKRAGAGSGSGGKKR
ncbi:aminotransferase [Cohnella sp. GCM10027633]|uniref:aminotransferase n=1 Tax=unclassified Cohnella TaxID=2636738 RepID=UPI003634AE7A